MLLDLLSDVCVCVAALYVKLLYFASCKPKCKVYFVN